MAKYTFEIQCPVSYSAGKATAVVGATVSFDNKGARLEAYANPTTGSAPFGFVKSCADEVGNPIVGIAQFKEIVDKTVSSVITEVSRAIIKVEVETADVKKTSTSSAISLSKELAAARQRIIDEKIMTEADVDEIINYLKTPDKIRIPAPDSLIIKDLNQMRKWDEPVLPPKARFIDRYEGVAEYSKNSIVTVCLNKALNGQATVFEGDKSVGKNVMAETIAWLMHRPYGKTTLNEKMSAEDLTGARTTAPSPVSKYTKDEALECISLSRKERAGEKLSSEDAEKAMEWEYALSMSKTPQIKVEETPLVDAVRNGGIFIADELNHGNANTVGSLNGLLDGSATFQTAALGRIEIHPDFVFIGTQNNGSKYSATNKLDAATCSRVGTVVFPYNESIKDILKEAVKPDTKDNLPDTYFEACDKLYKGIKKCLKDGSVTDEALNVRGFVSALNETASIMNGNKPLVPLSDAIKTCIINSCAKDRENPILTGLVSKCIGTL